MCCLTWSVSGFWQPFRHISWWDELFLNWISKGFGTSVHSCNLKCGFLFSLSIWKDVNECLKKNHNLCSFSCYLISLCLLNAHADCTHCAGRPYLVCFVVWIGRTKGNLLWGCDKAFTHEMYTIPDLMAASAPHLVATYRLLPGPGIPRSSACCCAVLRPECSAVWVLRSATSWEGRRLMSKASVIVVFL